MYALLIASDPDEAAVLSTALQRAGLAVTVAQNLERAMHHWPSRPADLILAAVFEPEPQAQVKLIRQVAQVPLVLVVNSPTEQQHCHLLENGADVVIARPYSTRLLIAQLRVLLRRAGGVSLWRMPSLTAAGLSLDPATRSVQVETKGQAHEMKRLTHLEFRLLYTLMINRGQALSIETIVERVWGYEGGDRDLVRGLVRRLRHKIELNPRQPQYVLTVPGIGYVFPKHSPTDSEVPPSPKK